MRKGTEPDHFGFEVGDVDAYVTMLCRVSKLRRKPHICGIIIHERGAVHDSWTEGPAVRLAVKVGAFGGAGMLPGGRPRLRSVSKAR